MKKFVMSPDQTGYKIHLAQSNYKTETAAAARWLCERMAKRLSGGDMLDQYFASALTEILEGRDPAAALNLKKPRGNRQTDPSERMRVWDRVMTMLLTGEADTPEDAAAHLEATGELNLKESQILNHYYNRDRSKHK